MLTDISLFLHLANGYRSTEWNKDCQGGLEFRALVWGVEWKQLHPLCWMQHQQVFPLQSLLKQSSFAVQHPLHDAFWAPPCGTAHSPLSSLTNGAGMVERLWNPDAPRGFWYPRSTAWINYARRSGQVLGCEVQHGDEQNEMSGCSSEQIYVNKWSCNVELQKGTKG